MSCGSACHIPKIEGRINFNDFNPGNIRLLCDVLDCFKQFVCIEAAWPIAGQPGAWDWSKTSISTDIKMESVLV